WRSICAFPDVLTQWSRGENLIPSGDGLLGVVSVNDWSEPALSHSRGRTGAPLAPVTCTMPAAPPRPGNEPCGAGARVRALRSDAVITLRLPTLSVIPVLVPGIVTGPSSPMGAVNELGVDEALNGTESGQVGQPSKLNFMVPVREYVTVEPFGVGVYLTSTGS